jgi:hypothetical protein
MEFNSENVVTFFGLINLLVPEFYIYILAHLCVKYEYTGTNEGSMLK